MAAAVTRPDGDWVDALPTLAGAGAAAWTLRWLLDIAAPGTGRVRQPTAAPPVAVDRRKFLLAGVATGSAAVIAGGLGRALRGRFQVDAARAAIVLPQPTSTVVVPAASEIGVEGVAPYLTPNSSFYRIDTALVVPQLSPSAWRLRIHGMVDRELTLTFDDLLARPMVERVVTLACVSNEVGGRLIGNARWLGVPLADVLAEAGVQDGADQLVSRSYDGWTCGTPTAIVLDGRDALLAVGMNGEPLPVSHGFPVRMVVPGLYGYVSATKWVTELELSTFDAFDAYWVRRGWAVEGPIKTMSRIDTPRHGAGLRPGTVTIAGVAWAQHRGITKVEVQVDEAAWQEARLADRAHDRRLEAVGRRLAGHARHPPAPGAGHRRRRLPADRGGGRRRPRRCDRAGTRSSSTWPAPDPALRRVRPRPVRKPARGRRSRPGAGTSGPGRPGRAPSS